MVGCYDRAGASEHLLQTDFPIGSLWKFPMLARRLSLLIATVKPDLIHSHFVGTTLSMRLALDRDLPLPRVFQVPGPLHLENRLFRNAELLTADRRDSWIGSCRWTCERYIKAGIDSRHVFLSYYGTDIDEYAPRTPGKLRRELGLAPECKIVGMVAFMYAPKRFLGQSRGVKGHEDLIDAFRLCLEHDENLRCVVVGGAWAGATAYERAVRAYARLRCGDRVIFLGTRADIPELYADFTVAVHPSHSENVGGAVESCLLGVPSIATRVGGFPDLLRDGETGWLVPAKKPEALASCILQVLGNPEEANRRALAGTELARQLFDVRKTAAEVKTVYERILAAR